MYDKISTALLACITTTKIQKKYDYEASVLEGTPALTLTAVSNESEYTTTTENMRVYSFNMRLWVPRGSTPAAEELCERTMRDLVDEVLDAIDRNYGLTTIETELGYTFIKLFAAPSQWGYADRDVKMRVAEIRVQVHYSVDTTVIS